MKTTTPQLRNSINRSPMRAFLLIALALGWLALSPQVQAVCQEGCLTNQNTVLGDDALLNNTGSDNTAIGFETLYSNTEGSHNVAIGASALYQNTTGTNNTANGFQALFTQTMGGDNTAIGYQALFSNTTGIYNTAIGSLALYSNTASYGNTAQGYFALYSNTTGGYNTANGVGALASNTTGSVNTATGTYALGFNTIGIANAAYGFDALYSNTTASFNTAIGYYALYRNTTGAGNTATGSQALKSNGTGLFNTATGARTLFHNTTGSNNTANGHGALSHNVTGSGNTANGVNALFSNSMGNNNISLGFESGADLDIGDKNIDIGNRGIAGESHTIRIGTSGNQANTYIAGISGVTVAGGVGVIIDGDGHLGTVVSSERFKDAIKPMDKASESILALKPVTFRYKKEFDPDGIPQFGLVAEQVEKVNPDLVARDDHGKPYTVRYEAVNAMLLNEFLKEHAKVEQLKKDFESKIAEQQKQIKALASGLQKVSAQVEMSRPAPQTVVDNH